MSNTLHYARSPQPDTPHPDSAADVISMSIIIRPHSTAVWRAPALMRLSVAVGAVKVLRANDSYDYIVLGGGALDLRAGEYVWLGNDGAQAIRVSFALNVPKWTNDGGPSANLKQRWQCLTLARVMMRRLGGGTGFC